MFEKVQVEMSCGRAKAQGTMPGEPEQRVSPQSQGEEVN